MTVTTINVRNVPHRARINVTPPCTRAGLSAIENNKSSTPLMARANQPEQRELSHSSDILYVIGSEFDSRVFFIGSDSAYRKENSKIRNRNLVRSTRATTEREREKETGQWHIYVCLLWWRDIPADRWVPLILRTMTDGAVKTQTYNKVEKLTPHDIPRARFCAPRPPTCCSSLDVSFSLPVIPHTRGKRSDGVSRRRGADLAIARRRAQPHLSRNHKTGADCTAHRGATLDTKMHPHV